VAHPASLNLPARSARLAGRWRALRPTTRALCVFIALNSVGVNVALTILPWTPDHKTVFSYSARTVLADGGTDSWGQMAVALGEFRQHPDAPLYHDVFFRRHIRFPYPPTSLLLTAAIERLGIGSGFLNLVSLLAVYGMIALVAVLLIASLSGKPTAHDRVDRIVLAVVGSVATLTFYPVVKGFALGQLQTWINFLLGLAIWLWLCGRERAAGVLAGIATVLKPHYGLLLAWGATRRRWGFCAAFAAVMLATLAGSLAIFGLRNHIDYLWMLSYAGRRGESYMANNAVNGFLHRLVFNGENLTWHEDRYPPYHPIVIAGTTVASAALVGVCLLWRRGSRGVGGVVDLMIATLTCVMASPVAWEHHYGVLLPIYAVIVPVAFRGSASVVGCLAVSYVLASNYFGVTRLAANTYFNFVQSFLLFGAVIVLAVLYSWRGYEEVSARIGTPPS
jgi:alpha-1,2-mannosyltransferase